MRWAPNYRKTLVFPFLFRSFQTGFLSFSFPFFKSIFIFFEIFLVANICVFYCKNTCDWWEAAELVCSVCGGHSKGWLS